MKKIGKYQYDTEKTIRIEYLGRVYEGIDMQSHKKVAIKIILKHQQVDTYILNSFIRKREITNILNSPHVIKKIQSIQSNHHIYIVQQFPDQGNLLEYMDKFNENQSQDVLITQLTHACVQLVRKGIIHRNLSPKSIVMKEGVLKICGFDRSCFGNKNLLLKSKIQNMPCASPQILMKNPQYSYKCDIWSYGILCYFIASKGKKLPFKLMKNQAYQYTNLVLQCKKGIQFEEQINQDLKDLIKGCLKFQQSDRFDWHQILSHPYFDGKFVQVCEIQFGSFKDYSFVFSTLRQILSNKQIDINEIMNKIQEQVSLQMFQEIFIGVDPHFNRLQLREIFQQMSEGHNTIPKQRIIKQFQIEKLLMSRKQQYLHAKNHLKDKISKFRQFLLDQQCDLFCIFRKLDTNLKGIINIPQIYDILEQYGCKLCEEDRKIFEQCFQVKKGKFLDWKGFYEPMKVILDL